ncbi:hypothetical protein R4172_15555 [Rhodococcus kroppenstedtii]|uniref:hypothetical protein n=1 Tax=Rhodococcoides kroppenstedtii TaxID=293050 RepID=UPI002952C143|nr:hypothetical protein [Rhodococcus kroppenstedtii]MDV7198966.1 hypothetical protein [Rhodococcus kroppenstedtii]
MSPYATGGGGVTFERKVAVNYLAKMLTGSGASELGGGRFIPSVSFQQNERSRVGVGTDLLDEALMETEDADRDARR